MLLFITSDTVYFVKENKPAAPLVRLEIPTSDYECSLIVDGEPFLVAICQDSNAVYAQIVSCTDEYDCFPAGSVTLPDVKEVSKAAILKNTLVVLDSDWEDPM